jgi:hypothetical protein
MLGSMMVGRAGNCERLPRTPQRPQCLGQMKRNLRLAGAQGPGAPKKGFRETPFLTFELDDTRKVDRLWIIGFQLFDAIQAPLCCRVIATIEVVHGALQQRANFRRYIDHALQPPQKPG